jgi:hypothetical protein
MENSQISMTEVQNILEANGLDFTISKRANFDENGTPSGFFGLWNDKLNKCLHNVREGYVVTQTSDVISMVLQTLTQFGNLRIHKAGVINNGCRIYVQVEVSGLARVGNDDVKRYITIIDSNDGSASLSVGIGDVTMSCMNQFWRFYNSGLKLRHTASMERKLKELPKMIAEALTHSDAQMKTYGRMFATSAYADSDLTHKLVKHVLGYDRKFTSAEDMAKKTKKSLEKMDNLYSCIESEMAEKGNNLWGMHSGVTFFTTHFLTAPKRENGKIESLMLGTGGQMNQKSLEFLTGYIG